VKSEQSSWGIRALADEALPGCLHSPARLQRHSAGDLNSIDAESCLFGSGIKHCLSKDLMCRMLEMSLVLLRFDGAHGLKCPVSVHQHSSSMASDRLGYSSLLYLPTLAQI